MCSFVHCFRFLDTFEVYMDQYIEEKLPPEFDKKFPETITVGQAVSVWKKTIYYQQNN